MDDLDEIEEIEETKEESSEIVSPYIITEIKSIVDISPIDLQTDNLYIILKNKLKQLFNKKCLENYGYIDSIYNIVDYSEGEILIDNFEGLIRYNVTYNAKICNPVINNLLECKVTNINNSIISAANGPIVIIISLQNINTKKFKINENSEIIKINEDKILKISDNIIVKILMSEFYDKKNEIFVFGYLENYI